MDALEVIPGRNIGRLHVLKKVGNFNGEDCYLCRDEKDRNVQLIESEIIAQAGEASEVVEDEVVEVTLTAVPLGLLMSKPIEDLEGQEIVSILIGVHGDNPPDDLSVDELRHRLEEKNEESEESPEAESVEVPEGVPEEAEKPLPKPKAKKKTKKKKGDK